MSNDRIDGMLSRHFARDTNDGLSAARVMTRLAQPLPRQKTGLFGALPGVLLDWQFAPAWPRVAALAACAALGFFLGMAGMDGNIDDASAQLSGGGTALAVVFEPEPLTGARP
ncbi:MAG: hypothetical protein JO254_08945 [Pseudolabrys sp.]|nr:hypothetical protein [Pseudolabrys sp.]